MNRDRRPPVVDYVPPVVLHVPPVVVRVQANRDHRPPVIDHVAVNIERSLTVADRLPVRALDED